MRIHKSFLNMSVRKFLMQILKEFFFLIFSYKIFKLIHFKNDFKILMSPILVYEKSYKNLILKRTCTCAPQNHNYLCEGAHFT
jgi:hypothetical protein